MARVKWEGEIAQGEREYEQVEFDRVVRAAKERLQGKDNAMRLEDFAQLPTLVGVEARTIRAILSNADGREFVIGQDLKEKGTNGMWLADFQEECEPFTRNLEARATTLANRVARRRKYAEEHLPSRQQALGF